jgi:hypothetical protein
MYDTIGHWQWRLVPLSMPRRWSSRRPTRWKAKGYLRGKLLNNGAALQIAELDELWAKAACSTTSRPRRTGEHPVKQLRAAASADQLQRDAPPNPDGPEFYLT